MQHEQRAYNIYYDKIAYARAWKGAARRMLLLKRTRILSDSLITMPHKLVKLCGVHRNIAIVSRHGSYHRPQSLLGKNSHSVQCGCRCMPYKCEIIALRLLDIDATEQ